MLKWLLYLIILANLGVLIWHLTRYQPATEAMHEKQSLSINADHIQIIKPQNAEKNLQPQRINSTLSANLAKPLKQDESTQQQPVTELVAGQSADESALDGGEIRPDKIAETNTQPSTGVADGENNLKQETQALEDKDNKQKKSAINVESVPVSTCYSLNPLQRAQAKKFGQFLKKTGIAYTEQQTTKIRPAGYLAMVAPASDYKAAKKDLKQVKKAGMDAFLITKGEWQRGISLGVFSSRAHAETIIKRARKKLPKLSLKIADRVREEIVYRVIFKLTSQQNPQDLLKKSQIMEMKGQFLAEVTKKSCKDVEF